MKNEQPRYLNIGCGSTIFPKPWENQDGRCIPGVDHISNINQLNFPDNTFDLVYASHVIEHVKRIENILGLVVGGQSYEYECHYLIYDKRSLTKLLEKCGLTAIHPWTPRRVSHGDIWDYSQAETWEVPISLNLEGRKTDTPLIGDNIFTTWKQSDPMGDKIYKNK